MNFYRPAESACINFLDGAFIIRGVNLVRVARGNCNGRRIFVVDEFDTDNRQRRQIDSRAESFQGTVQRLCKGRE